MRRRWLVTAVALACTGTAAYVAGSMSAGISATGSATERAALRGFSRVVFLSHANNPVKTPVFPGDPSFSLTTKFTVHHDGFYLQYIKEGEHTGTHYSAPCHFHVDALCADELSARDFVLPAVVLDIRAKVRNDVDYHVTISDLRAWQAHHGAFPKQAAVLLETGCDRWWSPRIGRDVPTYYNCGSAAGRFRQPGFSKAAVKWLIDHSVLGIHGALGTDTFGPDPGDDPNFVETFLTLKHHRFTIENMTNLDAMPTRGGWVVIGGPRNRHGSGAPSTVFGLVP